MARLANKIMEAFVGLRVDDSELAGDVARTKGKIGEQFAQAGTTAGQKFKAAFGVAAQNAANAGAYSPYSGGGFSGGVNSGAYSPYGGGGFMGGLGPPPGPSGGAFGGMFGGGIGSMLTSTLNGIGLYFAANIGRQVGEALANATDKLDNFTNGFDRSLGNTQMAIDKLPIEQRPAAYAKRIEELQSELSNRRERDEGGNPNFFVRGFENLAQATKRRFGYSIIEEREKRLLAEEAEELKKSADIALNKAKEKAAELQKIQDKSATSDYMGRISFNVERFVDESRRLGRR